MADEVQDDVRAARELAAAEGEHVEIVATGRPTGHVADVRATNNSPEAASLLKEILGYLAGGIAAGGLLLLRTCRSASTSQVLGITKVGSPELLSGAAPLEGVCMQHRKTTPAQMEPYVPKMLSGEELTTTRKVGAILAAAEATLPEFYGDYFFLEKIPDFQDIFRQVAVWLVTDNIGFAQAKGELFPPRMLFTSGPLEILFWLRESIKRSGLDLQDFRFDGELVKCFDWNHEMGFISDDQYREWQERFSFKFSSP